MNQEELDDLVARAENYKDKWITIKNVEALFVRIENAGSFTEGDQQPNFRVGGLLKKKNNETFTLPLKQIVAEFEAQEANKQEDAEEKVQDGDTDDFPTFDEAIAEGERRQKAIKELGLTDEEIIVIADRYSAFNPDLSTVKLYLGCKTSELPDKEKLILLFANFLAYRSLHKE